MIVNHAARSNRRTPELKVPDGTPSVAVVSDVLLVANNPSITARWYGRASLKDTRRTYNAKPVWVLCYAQSEAHHLLRWSQLHFRFSNDYGETWSEEDKWIDGTSVLGAPMYAPTTVPGQSLRGPGEPWLYLCPNGDLLNHMWDSQYNVSNNGTYQSRSTDGGKTWSTPQKITFINNTGISISSNDNIFSTDDDFVYNGVIYAGAREYLNYDTFDSEIRSWLIKSTDNGNTWELVSLLSEYDDITNEYGLEYVGNDTIVSCVREFVGPPAFYTKSLNLGKTWASLTDVSSIYGTWSRQRVKTRSNVKSKVGYYRDPVVFCHGFIHVNGGNSHPRRIAVWVSKDSGETFTGPLYLKDQGYDGGYGDFLYNPIKGEYVTVQYYAPTSLYDGEIRQINWKLNFT